MANANLSKEFFELLKAIGESKSKQEEDRIIEREIICLKKKLESPASSSSGLPHKPVIGGGGAPAMNTALSSKKKAKEFLVRLLYVEMLGHDGSFGYIKAMELAASSFITHKRTGYLVCSSCLPPEHEFRFMLVNQMQRDLSSSSVLEVCAALGAVSILITSDMVPALSGEVLKLLNHANENVRKKVIIVLYRFYSIAPEVLTKADLIDKLRRSLCDRDPAVMGSSLNVIECMAELDSTPFKDLIPSLISILKQVCEHRLPSDFDYHRVPAPWIQMKIVRILGILGRKDANASNGMYEIIGDCMRRADIGINAGYAVVYECVRTITGIYPNPNLLDAAAEAISRFISSRSHNLKYLGVTGLAFIVEVGPQYAAPHQLAVIECLEDRDETLQRKTLDLLYRMTNPVNVEFITSKMLEFLRGTTDQYLKSSLTHRICSVAERYAPSNAWYLRVTTDLFEISGDLVKADVAQNLMSLIAEGSGEEDTDVELRRNAVELYVSLLDRPNLPKILTETMAWVLGEYAYLSSSYTIQEILSKLCTLAKKINTVAASPSTRKFLATAVMKLVAQCGTCPPIAAHVIDDFTKSTDVDLQQRCLEFQNLLTSASHILGDVLPVDASCEDVEADPELNYLNDFVEEARRNGAAEYSPPDDDDYDDTFIQPVKTGFNITPYERPKAPTDLSYANSIKPNTTGGQNAPDGSSMPMNTASAVVNAEPQLVIRTTANVWGKGGLAQPAPAAPPVASVSKSAPPPSWTTTSAVTNSSPYQASAQVEPAKSRELTERERMAAALFGGVVPGASNPPPPVPSHVVRPNPPKMHQSVPQPPPPPPPPVQPATPAQPPAPAAEVDLLDLGFGAPSQPPSTPTNSVDPFSNFLSNAPPVAPSPPIFNGSTLVPLNITTAQFGQAWSSMTSSTQLQIPRGFSNPKDFLQKCLGFSVVEVIAATNEGIAAGSFDNMTVLLHAKIAQTKVDVLIRTGDKEAGKVVSSWISERC